MNYTVTYSQTSGPANDALETSYREVGDFALGSPADWFQFRFIDDDDLDNDGTIDVCDFDIDGDNDDNPIIGHPKYCPGVGRYESGDQPMSISEWISLNDADGDGVHDEVKDRDIDGVLLTWFKGKGFLPQSCLIILKPISPQYLLFGKLLLTCIRKNVQNHTNKTIHYMQTLIVIKQLL